MKNKTIVLLVVVTLIISNLLSLTIYQKLTMETRADYNISRGYSYIESNQYDKATKAFEKAIRIKKPSIEARIGLAWAYADENKYDDAKSVLTDAYNIDKTHAKLITNAIKILKNFDIDTAFNMLTGYMETVDGNLADPEVLEMRASMMKDPELPSITPASGTYVNELAITFNTDSQPLGTRIYYTTDGTEPSNSSPVYKEPIPLKSGSVEIRAVAYNASGKKSSFFSGKYSIDPDPLNDLKAEIKNAQAIYDDTVEGKSVGNCISGAKKPFDEAIKSAQEVAEKKDLQSEDASEACDILVNAVKNFNSKIIEKTDLTELESAITTAQKLIKNKVEGTEVGNQKIGSKDALQKKIDAATAVKNNILSRQSDINAALTNLNSAITTYKASIVKRS